MGQQLWVNPLVMSVGDGPTQTAAAAATLLPSSTKYTLAPNFWYPGKQLRVTASGRISCVASAPGTARYDVRFGTVVVFDGGAVPMNPVGKVSVGWWLEILLTCRTISNTAATLMGAGRWTSEAGVGAPLPSAGGAPPFVLPFNAPPVVGNGFDSTAAQPVDLFFTQTVGTGQVTLHQYLLEEIG
jgi:hypothetical protein